MASHQAWTVVPEMASWSERATQRGGDRLARGEQRRVREPEPREKIVKAVARDDEGALTRPPAGMDDTKHDFLPGPCAQNDRRALRAFALHMENILAKFDGIGVGGAIQHALCIGRFASKILRAKIGVDR